MKTIGRHLIAEFYGATDTALDDIEGVRAAMIAAAEAIGATVVGDTFHRFAPQGVSGTVVIAESHLSVHTWPESGYVALDIYTCGGLDPRVGLELLARSLGAHSLRVQEIVRGLPEEIRADETWGPDDVRILSQAVRAEPVPQPS